MPNNLIIRLTEEDRTALLNMCLVLNDQLEDLKQIPVEGCPGLSVGGLVQDALPAFRALVNALHENA